MLEDRYPKQFCSQEIYNLVEVDRGKPEVKWWIVYIRTECLQKVEKRDSSAASFMASVEECISEGECKLYDEGLNIS